jgi:hypothetical protein
MCNQFLQALYFKDVVYSRVKWHGLNNVLVDSKQCKEMRMQIFHFDESYITRRRKCLSFSDAQCPKILLNSSISRTSRNEPKRLYTNTRFFPPKKMPKTMQFCYFKCKDSPYLMQSKKLNFLFQR